MENNNICIKKIPLDSLIDVLVDLFDKGVDYIDILGAQGDDKDYMAISFCKEYMCEESQEEFTAGSNIITKEDITNYKLSEEDINDLI